MREERRGKEEDDEEERERKRLVGLNSTRPSRSDANLKTRVVNQSPSRLRLDDRRRRIGLSQACLSGPISPRHSAA